MCRKTADDRKKDWQTVIILIIMGIVFGAVCARGIDKTFAVWDAQDMARDRMLAHE